MAGRFVWHEYMAKDTDAAIAFYGELFAWKTQPFDESPAPSPYTMWVSSQGALGGLMKLPDSARAMGVPPHWMGYVEVEDLDATLAKAKIEGVVHVPPTFIPKVGRFSVIADPQGAALSIIQTEPMDPPLPRRDLTQAGEFVWNELHAKDARTALAFYSDLFGWELRDELDMGPAGEYLIFGRGDEQYGAVMTKSADTPMPPSWVYYVHVDDLDAAIARATSQGATKNYGPMPIPDGGRIAYLSDPQGAVFALHAAS